MHLIQYHLTSCNLHSMLVLLLCIFILFYLVFLNCIVFTYFIIAFIICYVCIFDLASAALKFTFRINKVLSNQVKTNFIIAWFYMLLQGPLQSVIRTTCA